MTHTIALVDDDRNILTSVEMALKAEGFNVITYNDGVSALAGLKNSVPDMGVFDVKMPRMDGLELLQNVRSFSEMPVIFLTSVDEDVDQILGLRLGADDYITKPFSQRLLVERIRAVLRRADAAKAVLVGEGKDVADTSTIMSVGALSLDDSRHLCTWDGKPVTLTVTEYLLLKSLASNPGHVKSRDKLIDAAYGESIYVDDRTIDSHIKRVRKKIKALNPDFESIETVYGVGYRYKDEGSD